MTRKLSSILFLFTALSIALGAFGHGPQWEKHFHPALAGTPPEIVGVIEYVWYWVSASMVAFGLMLLWLWWLLLRGRPAPLWVAWAIGAFYIVEGLYGVLLFGRFYGIFIVQGTLVWLCTWMLRPTR